MPRFEVTVDGNRYSCLADNPAHAAEKVADAHVPDDVARAEVLVMVEGWPFLVRVAPGQVVATPASPLRF